MDSNRESKILPDTEITPSPQSPTRPTRIELPGSPPSSAGAVTASSSDQALVQLKGNNHGSQSKSFRGKAFTVEEDEQLCLSWLAIIQGPVACSNQRGSTFWNQVQAHYAQFKGWDNERSDVSLMHRWSVIQHSVSRFSKIIAQIERRNRSEKADEDNIVAAKRMYQTSHLLRSRSQKKPFTLEHCWNILRGNDKWEEYIKRPTKKFNETLKNAVGAPATPATPAILAPLGSIDSETGDSVAVGDLDEKVIIKKPERIIRKKRKEYDEIIDKLLEQNEEIMEIMMKKEERAWTRKVIWDERVQRMADERIMRAELSGMSEIQKDYYANRRADVVARLKLAL
ncbi:hypothetical protein GIB67_021301 [Kingdonia uniflora]|uniref:No apical meristem-associated C-terminal domain-containing protein n=1 Tax=Kingdonia uniflora TaxID=39325 RepID=A0A7J7LXY4_9MAGN|nr:hypothetical protein GIB67_021301 [Kingdonia uniflora]